MALTSTMALGSTWFAEIVPGSPMCLATIARTALLWRMPISVAITVESTVAPGDSVRTSALAWYWR